MNALLTGPWIVRLVTVTGMEAVVSVIVHAGSAAENVTVPPVAVAATAARRLPAPVLLQLVTTAASAECAQRGPSASADTDERNAVERARGKRKSGLAVLTMVRPLA